MAKAIKYPSQKSNPINTYWTPNMRGTEEWLRISAFLQEPTQSQLKRTKIVMNQSIGTNPQKQHI
jgi:hypothetical protein